MRLLKVLPVFAMLVLTGCGPKLTFNNTWLNPTEPLPIRKVAGRGRLVLLPAGEWLDVSPILEAEGARPRQAVIMKFHGRYVLAADGFQNVWLIDPGGSDRAGFEGVPATAGGQRMAVPRFVFDSRRENCLEVEWQTASGGQMSMFLTREGKLHAACPE